MWSGENEYHGITYDEVEGVGEVGIGGDEVSSTVEVVGRDTSICRCG